MRSTVSVVGVYWISCISSFWIDHLARRRRHVDADDEVGRVGLADAQRAAAGFDVLGQHLHAAHEIVAVRGQRLAQHFRIGEHEIRRRDRVGDLLDVELGLLARVRIEAFGVLHQFLRPLRGEQIELQHEIEELVRFPLRILEALVARRRLDRGLGRLRRPCGARPAPEIEIGLADLGLQVRGALVVREPVFGDRGEGLDDLADFARAACPSLRRSRAASDRPRAPGRSSPSPWRCSWRRLRR